MKKKEINQIATLIAEGELTIMLSSDPTEIAKAKKQILKASTKITSLEDIAIVDEKVQKIISKILDK